MIKTFLVSISTLLIVANAKGQKQVSFGLKAGVNFATVQNYFTDNKFKVGVNAGLFSKFRFSKNFAFQPELFYSQKGTKYGTSIGDRTLSLTYFSLPLLGQYLPTQKLSVSAGPELNFRLGTPTAYRTFDLTIVAGVSYWIKRLGIDLRYDHGFNNLIELEALDENGYETGQKKTFGSNRVLQLSLMYTLTKGN